MHPAHWLEPDSDISMSMAGSVLMGRNATGYAIVGLHGKH